MKALIIATDKFEDSELFYPYYRIQEENIDVEVATPTGNSIEGKNGIEIDADLLIEDINPTEYDLLVLPGGRSPEHLRLEAPETIEIVKEFDKSGKNIASICHGAQLLMSADLLEGRKATCYWSIKDDLENAGGEFLDKPVVIDENIITSRHPPDLPDFMAEVIDQIT